MNALRHLLMGSAALAIAACASPGFAAKPKAPPKAETVAGVHAQRGFTARDMVTLDRVSDAHASPDGRWIAYDLRTVDYAANKAAHSIWIVDATAKDPQPRRLAISEGGATGPRWSADGKWLYFTSSRSGSDQVWRTTAEGTEAVQVTKLPLDVGAWRVSPDGKTILVSLAVYPDCKDLECTVKRNEKPKGSATGQMFDRLMVRHWDTWADGTNNHLFAIKLDEQGLATGPLSDVMAGFDGDVPGKPFGDEGDFVFTPDSQGVVFSAKVNGRDAAWSTNFDLYWSSLNGGPAKNLTAANKAEDVGPVFSPDGSMLAYRAMKRPGFEADRFGVMVMDVKSGAVREIDPQWDRSADDIKWSADGKTLYASAEDVGQVRVFAIDVASGAVKPLTGEGRISGFDMTSHGLMTVRDNFAHPADIWLQDGKHDVALTHHNVEKLAGIGMGGYEQFSFPGWNGETVHGYVVKPWNYVEGKKYPVAFLIHGGPQGSFGNLFHYRWNAQTYAGAGYAVVLIDFHGSTGYGQGFTDAISQHWGDRPLEDLQKGWAYAQAKYPFLDGNRACALGGSYGGYMVNWIAGNWNGPWKCLVNHDGVFDNRMMGYSTEELWFSEWENGGTVWGNPAGYEKFNPVNHVDAWVKPEMVIQGGRDYRIPLEQGLGTFSALQRKGVPSQFLYFPDENHWVLKPKNSVEWHDAVLDWLNRWTKE
ncbi:MAG: S9 family peptidase [Proteobacteria bacterium]|nr:S9 family peptidase [Pseudomonadota bacterium]